MNYLKQYESFFWLIGIFIFYLIMAILTPLSTTDWHAYKVFGYLYSRLYGSITYESYLFYFEFRVYGYCA